MAQQIIVMAHRYPQYGQIMPVLSILTSHADEAFDITEELWGPSGADDLQEHNPTLEGGLALSAHGGWLGFFEVEKGQELLLELPKSEPSEMGGLIFTAEDFDLDQSEA